MNWIVTNLDTGHIYRCRCQSFRMAIYRAVASTKFNSSGTLRATIAED